MRGHGVDAGGGLGGWVSRGREKDDTQALTTKRAESSVWVERLEG